MRRETGNVLLALSSLEKDDSEEILYDGFLNDHKVVVKVDSGDSYIFASRKPPATVTYIYMNTGPR